MHRQTGQDLRFGRSLAGLRTGLGRHFVGRGDLALTVSFGRAASVRTALLVEFTLSRARGEVGLPIVAAPKVRAT